jgi:hypothetical protein
MTRGTSAVGPSQRLTPTHVRVQVSPAALRGVPFAEFEAILGNIIGERFAPDSFTIIPTGRTEVLFDGRADTPDALELLEIVSEMTDPAYRDGFFG